MPAAELTSAVFILRPETHFAPRQFLGRMAHRLFLLMLHQSGSSALADSLHDQNGALPYTISDIFANGQTHYWMRVTGLTPAFSQVISDLCQKSVHQPISVPPRDHLEETAWTFTVEAAVLSHHEWANSLSYAEFVRATWQSPKPRQITLEFVTPTLIKSVGVQHPFPLPGLIFRLLYERLSRLNGLEIPFRPESSFVDAFADYFLEIVDYQIHCVTRLPIKDERAAGFHGSITYRQLSSNEDFRKRAAKVEKTSGDGSLLTIQAHIERHSDDYMRLVNLLGQFAFYSGIGKYTGQGMGMVRAVESPPVKQIR